MRVLKRITFVLSLLTVLPASAFAQATLSGTVKDSSGAILPGTTVEAASPVLIEKVRTAVTTEQVNTGFPSCLQVLTR